MAFRPWIGVAAESLGLKRQEVVSREDIPDRSVANHLGRDPHLSRKRLSHASGDFLH